MAVFIEVKTEDMIFERYLESLLTDAGYSVVGSADGLPEGAYGSLCIFSPRALTAFLSAGGTAACPILAAGYRDEFDGSEKARVRGASKTGITTLYRPFTDEALISAVAALVSGRKRRTTPDALTLNKNKRTVSMGKSKVSLTEREYALLALLFERRGEAVPLEEINRVVWDCDTASASNVTAVYVNYLRKKLALLTDRPLILSVRGKGYRLRTDI